MEEGSNQELAECEEEEEEEEVDEAKGEDLEESNEESEAGNPEDESKPRKVRQKPMFINSKMVKEKIELTMLRYDVKKLDPGCMQVISEGMREVAVIPRRLSVCETGLRRGT